jgi:phage baseplate assembly protein W
VKAISYPFRLAPGGKIAVTKSYDEVVRGQVIDALMTNQGERVMRPQHGCDIQASLFDPSDELVRRDAASVIKERLQQFVPRCFVRSVKIEIAPQPYLVYVNVVYKPNLYATDQVLELPVSSEFIARSLVAAAQEEVA